MAVIKKREKFAISVSDNGDIYRERERDLIKHTLLQQLPFKFADAAKFTTT